MAKVVKGIFGFNSLLPLELFRTGSIEINSNVLSSVKNYRFSTHFPGLTAVMQMRNTYAGVWKCFRSFLKRDVYG